MHIRLILILSLLVGCTNSDVSIIEKVIEVEGKEYKISINNHDDREVLFDQKMLSKTDLISVIMAARYHDSKLDFKKSSMFMTAPDLHLDTYRKYIDKWGKDTASEYLALKPFILSYSVEQDGFTYVFSPVSIGMYKYGIITLVADNGTYKIVNDDYLKIGGMKHTIHKTVNEI